MGMTDRQWASYVRGLVKDIEDALLVAKYPETIKKLEQIITRLKKDLKPIKLRGYQKRFLYSYKMIELENEGREIIGLKKQIQALEVEMEPEDVAYVKKMIAQNKQK